MANFDSRDKAILKELQADARLPVVEMAKRVNLSATPCTNRIRRMEQEGVISGYHARLNPIALDLRLLVFVMIKLRDTDEGTLRKFNAAMRDAPEVCECHLVGGDYDYLLKLRLRDMQGYREFLGGVLGSLGLVEGTNSHFVVDDVKESAVLPLD